MPGSPSRPDLIRALLAADGIIADRLSATVLLFNVVIDGDGPIDRRLRESPAPVALTLLDLVEQPPLLAPQVLTVVENPSVIEIAYTTGIRQPLACTSGQLRAVDHTLFQLAVKHGVTLRYAGDIDPAGRQIAAAVAATYGAQLIGMDEETAAAASLRLAILPGFDVSGGAGLSPVYQEHDAVLVRILDQSAGLPPLRKHRDAEGA
ncbi:DUF2399 domain-containing protein [Actinoplanes sp. CA-054009]